MTKLLQGKKILITREAKQARTFSEKILQHGGIPVEVPLLKITCQHRPKDERAFESFNKYDWIFFTSANGADCFMKVAHANCITASMLKQKKYAVVGKKTEQALNAYGFAADFTPSVYNADHMATEFLNAGHGKETVLLVRGNLSRDVLPYRFTQAGVHFETVEVYETAQNLQASAELKRTLTEEDVDYITFTSPSAVDAFMDLSEQSDKESEAICVCIGTTTERRASEAGFKQILTPEQFTIEGMLTSMLNHTAKKG